MKLYRSALGLSRACGVSPQIMAMLTLDGRTDGRNFTDGLEKSSSNAWERLFWPFWAPFLAKTTL